MENLASRTAQTHARLIKAATKVFATAGCVFAEKSRERHGVFRHRFESICGSFTGMLLHGILRFSDIPSTLEYSRECYIETCVNLFVRGISTSPLKETGCSVNLSTI
ncbi:MAG: hypothetical protein ICV54_17235 [Nostoc sp. C3-bin3]|nr:hypothetical protein [Nostoc sp. C3-bin3]